MEFMVTRASEPMGLETAKIETMGDLLSFVKSVASGWPVLINPLGDSWQLKIFDDPELLRDAQALYPILFPSTIARIHEGKPHEKKAVYDPNNEIMFVLTCKDCNSRAVFRIQKGYTLDMLLCQCDLERLGDIRIGEQEFVAFGQEAFELMRNPPKAHKKG